MQEIYLKYIICNKDKSEEVRAQHPHWGYLQGNEAERQGGRTEGHGTGESMEPRYFHGLMWSSRTTLGKSSGLYEPQFPLTSVGEAGLDHL